MKDLYGDGAAAGVIGREAAACGGAAATGGKPWGAAGEEAPSVLTTIIGIGIEDDDGNDGVVALVWIHCIDGFWLC